MRTHPFVDRSAAPAPRTGGVVVVMAAVAAAAVAAALFAGCAAPLPYMTASGRPAFAEEGMASYYAEEFNGRKTSSGETYDMHAMTAAHRTLPFGSRVRVKNLETGKSVVVRINDRGPFRERRIIDLSLAAAKALELIGSGTVRVRIELIGGPADH